MEYPLSQMEYPLSDMEYPLSQLKQHHPLSAAFIAALGGMIKKQEPSRQNTLLIKGEICDKLYLIEEGILGCFDIDENRKYCTWLMTRGDFVTAVDSFNNRVVSTETIISLTDSVVWFITRGQFDELTQRFPEFAIIRQKLTDKYHIQSRVMDARRKRPPEQFYEYLLTTYPEIITHAPMNVLASLMGIDRSTLYGIMNRRPKKR